MNAATVIFHQLGRGTDTMSGREDQDGAVVTIEQLNIKERFISWRSLKQLLNLNVPQLDDVPEASYANSERDGQALFNPDSAEAG